MVSDMQQRRGIPKRSLACNPCWPVLLTAAFRSEKVDCCVQKPSLEEAHRPDYSEFRCYDSAVLDAYLVETPFGELV